MKFLLHILALAYAAIVYDYIYWYSIAEDIVFDLYNSLIIKPCSNYFESIFYLIAVGVHVANDGPKLCKYCNCTEFVDIGDDRGCYHCDHSHN